MTIIIILFIEFDDLVHFEKMKLLYHFCENLPKSPISQTWFEDEPDDLTFSLCKEQCVDNLDKI